LAPAQDQAPAAAPSDAAAPAVPAVPAEPTAPTAPAVAPGETPAPPAGEPGAAPAEQPAPVDPNVEPPAGDAQGQVPPDLLDDPHVREELGVNEFTAPSIEKIFEKLTSLSPLPVAETRRVVPARMPLDRADLAVELGFLLADGFLIVQTQELGRVDALAEDLNRYGKALGAGDRVNRHAAGLLESARKQKVDQLKMELNATQKDVEMELVKLRDADLAHLISMGGWIRALEVSALGVQKNFTEERARILMREDIADYYTEMVGSLEPRIAERPNFLRMRELLTTLRDEMTLNPGVAPTRADVDSILVVAKELAKIAQERSR
jgi:hypothetical protein